jgi:hypothetical protein
MSSSGKMRNALHKTARILRDILAISKGGSDHQGGLGGCSSGSRKAPERLQPLRGEVRPLGEGEHYQPTQPLPTYFYSLKGREIYSQPFP